MAGSMEITPSLRAALGELYYKEGCDQQGWAIVPLRGIDVKNNILVFSKGVQKISIRLMDRIVPEVKEISRPVKGGFVFDYLACRVGQQKKYEGAVLADPAALCWVKIGRGTFSNDQIEALGRIKIPLAVFRIRDLLVPPAKIEMKWEIKTGEEWLDEIDDLRDQAESDDDYL
jgi:hypothetical protein